MSDQNNRGFFLAGELGQKLDDERAGGGVEITGGLIGKENRGAMDEGACDGGALQLTAGELVRAMMGAVGELNGLKKMAGTIPS